MRLYGGEEMEIGMGARIGNEDFKEPVQESLRRCRWLLEIYLAGPIQSNNLYVWCRCAYVCLSPASVISTGQRCRRFLIEPSIPDRSGLKRHNEGILVKMLEASKVMVSRLG